jgi:phosphate transport system substrate-binding protein
MSSGPVYGGSARISLLTTPVALALIAGLFYFGSEEKTGTEPPSSVQVAGSETMREVVGACAEEFMSRNPEADIIVRGGGSGDGIAALLHGMTDVAMVSRELSSREREFARSKTIVLNVVPVALDGIAIIVNRANPASELTVQQVRDTFAGTVRNWRALGGSDAEIGLLARAAGSGTGSVFDERVMQGEPYAAAVRLLPTNDEIVAAVAAQPGAIGYTGLGAMKGASEQIKVLALRSDTQTPAALPTPETIRSRAYPLTRSLTLVTAGKPAEGVAAFVAYCSGEDAQSLLHGAGYIPSGSNAGRPLQAAQQ